MQVLIVEDERAVAQAIANVLESRGHEVSLASDARSALKLPAPDVLIADPEMPGLSGLDLLEEYREAGCAPRTVFLTSTPSLESCRRALRLGAAEFLSKPFRLDDLVRAVETRGTSPVGVFDKSYSLANMTVAGCLRDLAAFAMQRGVGPTCRARACSALGEIITNVAEHAYANGTGEFQITATVDRLEFHVTVVDKGLGMETATIATDIMSTGGGLSRALSLSENLDVESVPKLGTTVHMSFGASQVDFAGPEQVDLTELDFLAPDVSRQILSAIETGGAENFFQLSPALAVVVGRLLAGPDPARIAAQALRS